MSFDLLLQSFRSGIPHPGNAKAARDVLLRYPHEAEPDYGFYEVRFNDGSFVEVYAGRLEDDSGGVFTDAMLALRMLTAPIAQFIFEFADAAGFVILNACAENVVVLTRSGLECHLPDELQREWRCIVLSSPDELFEFLRGGYEGWRRYLGKVSGGG